MATRNGEPGMAHIKPEFLVLDHKPVVDTEYISKNVKEELEKEEMNPTDANEPPAKKMKLKGRNKKRPKGKRIDASEKLCPAVVQERICQFGEKCKFSHDKKLFLASKPADIAEECYLYNTYGKCDFGITCRFAKCHLSENLDNLRKEDFTSTKPRIETVKNILKKDLQVSLWKKKYDFSRSNKVLDEICPEANKFLKGKDKQAESNRNKKNQKKGFDTKLNGNPSGCDTVNGHGEMSETLKDKTDSDKQSTNDVQDLAENINGSEIKPGDNDKVNVDLEGSGQVLDNVGNKSEGKDKTSKDESVDKIDNDKSEGKDKTNIGEPVDKLDCSGDVGISDSGGSAEKNVDVEMSETVTDKVVATDKSVDKLDISGAAGVRDSGGLGSCMPDEKSVDVEMPETVTDKAGVGVNGDMKLDTRGSDEKSVDVETSETVTDKVGVGVNGDMKIDSEGVIKLRPQEKKMINFSDKLYLAPLTTVGNLPFRRICKEYGADITCGEMAVSTNLLQGQQSEWALLKRHESEDIFGVQICGAYPDSMTRCAQLITESMDVDFIDINCGCPIDLIFNKGEGSALMGRLSKFEQIVKGMRAVMDVPLTAKIRTGIYSDKSTAHTLVPQLRDWGCALTTIHGRSRVQRYTKLADWDYISDVAKAADPMPLFGNGDILSFEEANQRREETGVSGIMIARGALIKPWIFQEIKEQKHWDISSHERGALIKPWIFQEIKEQKHWDISSHERYEMLKKFRNYGLDHWGSDHQGVENTRRFLLEWLSFLYRYIPVGVLERVPQRINERPPYYTGRDDMETLMASPNCGDWIKLSEMLLGPVPDDFNFLPKHKANAYK